MFVFQEQCYIQKMVQEKVGFLCSSPGTRKDASSERKVCKKRRILTGEDGEHRVAGSKHLRQEHSTNMDIDAAGMLPLKPPFQMTTLEQIQAIIIITKTHFPAFNILYLLYPIIYLIAQAGKIFIVPTKNCYFRI